MTRVEGHPIPFRAKLLALGALGVAGPVLVACGTRAGGPEVSGQGGNDGNTEPVATRTETSEIPATSVVPTETISIPEPTATEEIEVLSPDELRNLVFDAIGTIPETQEVRDIIGLINSGLANMDQVERGEISVKSPINNFGEAGLRLASLANQNPNNILLCEAWNADKTFVEAYSLGKEENGQLIQGSTKAYIEFFFLVSPVCENSSAQ